MTRFFRSAVTTGALALMLAGAVHALPLERRSTHAGPAALIERFQSWLASVGSPQTLSSFWAEAGSIMDPNG